MELYRLATIKFDTYVLSVRVDDNSPSPVMMCCTSCEHYVALFSFFFQAFVRLRSGTIRRPGGRPLLSKSKINVEMMQLPRCLGILATIVEIQ